MELSPAGIFAVSAVGAVLFALAAVRTGRAWWLWALWGVLTGLTVATLTVGLAHAAALPYSSGVVTGKYWLGAVIAIAIMALIAAGIVFFDHYRGKTSRSPH